MTFRLTEEEAAALIKRDTRRTVDKVSYHVTKTAAKSTAAARKPQGNSSKYKQEIDLIFMALEQPRRQGGLPLEVTKEYYFAKPRKWRFDWALEAIKVAVEYEGLPLQVEKSRHTTIKGFCGDCEKYSEAAIAGWCVVRVNAISVDSGLAHDLIKRAVDSRKIGYEEVASKRRDGNVCDI